MRPPNLQRRYVATASIVMLLGMLATYAAYWPGLMSPDSSEQFAQALSGQFNDWHPPIMAWIWSRTNALIAGPGGLFLLFVAAYWIGFFLVSCFFIRQFSPRYLVVSFLPFSPFLFNFAGTLWKDVLVMVCLLNATATALLMPWSRQNLRGLSLPLFALLVALGCLARHNSALAAGPLVVLYCAPSPVTRHPVPALIRRLLAATFLVLVISLSFKATLDRWIFHAEKTHHGNQVLIWDLAGMSQRIGVNLLPGPWTGEQDEAIRTRCWRSVDANLYLTSFSCGFVFDILVPSPLWRDGSLLRAWLAAIVAHPATYAAVRLDDATGLLWPHDIFVEHPNSGSLDYGFRPNKFFAASRMMVFGIAHVPGLHLLFTVAFWLCASIIMSLRLAIRFARGNAAVYTPLLVAASGALNIAPILVLSAGPDLRYAYWTIAATCLACLLPTKPPKSGGLPAACANPLQTQSRSAERSEIQSSPPGESLPPMRTTAP
jgi:hypothetical protein